MKRTSVLIAMIAASCGDSDPAPASDPTVAEFSVTIRNVASDDALVTEAGDPVDVALSPGVWSVDDPSVFLVSPGDAASAGLESLAESGAPSDFLTEARQRLEEARSFGGDSSSSYGDQPMMPGARVSFGFRATEGQAFSLATMFGQSNDIIIATDAPWPLFDAAGLPYVGTIPLTYFDVGTERNEEPGVGANQAPRQANPTDGEPESEVITAFDTEDRAGFRYPALPTIVILEITEATEVEPEE